MARGSKTARRRRRGRQAERVPRKARRRNWLFIAYGAFAVALVGIMIFFLAARPASPSPTSPQPTPGRRYIQPNEHWHAAYTISVCGTPLPQFPETTSSSGIHTHGDGLIHLEPQIFGEAGTNAHLARFMASTGSTLTDTELHLASGQKYANGDTCPDGRPGRWVLRVNGQVVTPIASYTPLDSEVIALSFEPQ